MSSSVLAPVVEGHGEMTAVPILLRRLAERLGFFSLRVAQPVRIPRDRMLRENELCRAVAWRLSASMEREPSC